MVATDFWLLKEISSVWGLVVWFHKNQIKVNELAVHFWNQIQTWITDCKRPVFVWHCKRYLLKCQSFVPRNIPSCLTAQVARITFYRFVFANLWPNLSLNFCRWETNMTNIPDFYNYRVSIFSCTYWSTDGIETLVPGWFNGWWTDNLNTLNYISASTACKP